MTDPVDDNINEAQDKRKNGKAGEGEQVGSGVAKLLSIRNVAQVAGEHRHLVGAELVEAIVEFFSELPMRASANLSVAWEKTKSNARSFALVNWMIEAGSDLYDMALKRGRSAGADANGLRQKQQTKSVKPGVNPKLDPSGPVGAQ